MDHITEACYNVMYQYRLAFTPDGVQANLNQWRQQKTPLLELLRRHPNWREQELAVVFDLSEQRQLDRACVDETKFEMLALAEEAGLTGERLEEFRDALDAATADYATVPDESRLPVIRNRGHIKCDAGMKASRIINRLCAKFGIDQYETERELGHGDTLHTARVKPYNAVFARLADALNADQQNRRIVRPSVRLSGDVSEEKRMAFLSLFSRRRMAGRLPVLYGRRREYGILHS